MTTVPVAERCSMCEHPDGIRAEYRCLECGALVCWACAEDHAVDAHSTPGERAYTRIFNEFYALPFWRRWWIIVTGGHPLDRYVHEHPEEED